VLHPLPISPQFDHPNKVCWAVQVANVLGMQFAPPPLLRPKVIPNALFAVGPGFTAIWNDDRLNGNYVVCFGVMAVGVRFILTFVLLTDWLTELLVSWHIWSWVSVYGNVNIPEAWPGLLLNVKLHCLYSNYYAFHG
jgi:hypothetical protein